MKQEPRRVTAGIPSLQGGEEAKEYLEISAVILGERAGRDPGDLTGLAESIWREGLGCPVAVTPEMRLVTGARRLEVYRAAGRRKIPGMIIRTVAEAVECLEAENADGRHAKPLSVMEAVGLDFAVRELEWPPRSPNGQAVSRAGILSRRLTAALGMDHRQYDRAREMACAARGYRYRYRVREPVSGDAQRRASEALARIRDNADINRAHQSLRMTLPAYRPSPEHPAERRPVIRAQPKAITTAVTALAGLVSGLENAGPLDPSISPQAIAQWDRDITRSMGILRGFRARLRKTLR